MKKQALSLALLLGGIFCVNAQNIYNTNGTLTGNRTVGLGNLYFKF
jgi:hypothetical protein